MQLLCDFQNQRHATKNINFNYDFFLVSSESLQHFDDPDTYSLNFINFKMTKGRTQLKAPVRTQTK